MDEYKAWVQKNIASFTNLEYTLMEYPKCNKGELIIETRAATLNFADLLLSSGMYQSNPEIPFVPGFEVAGIVKEVSPNSAFEVGDRVIAATTVFRSGRHGSFGDYCIASENLTYKLPSDISYEVGAAILMSYLTSDFALHRRAELKNNELVLINAAAGGVGIAALQLAKIYLLVKNITIMGVFMISFEENDKEYLKSRIELIFEHYRNKKIEPVFETIDFQNIIEYLNLIGSRKTVGRIVAVK